MIKLYPEEKVSQEDFKLLQFIARQKGSELYDLLTTVTIYKDDKNTRVKTIYTSRRGNRETWKTDRDK